MARAGSLRLGCCLRRHRRRRFCCCCCRLFQHLATDMTAGTEGAETGKVGTLEPETERIRTASRAQPSAGTNAKGSAALRARRGGGGRAGGGGGGRREGKRGGRVDLPFTPFLCTLALHLLYSFHFYCFSLQNGLNAHDTHMSFTLVTW